ncbi:peptide chain release factor N(5)-glutamine methyltransferase [Candidatus Falkowbacteria bacterium CG_4_10_14_0_2_um_filter_41_15]|uniref:peptide chain release factor N(5)-glutamine methyltransferase n=1 Tax=Candidatus Falkowbacteria bacterium CG_4_10_14_0_2_um_filter_41_15 TaxID=1974554 RepID=A0A2M7VZY2_9BACT|nr:MAG: peptide chain release factor N(5)-glutamine methyltransferase [Candidatus Falkowbacteria bacterium CG_4_10_14_0_2_um_filter_41_15]
MTIKQALKKNTAKLSQKHIARPDLEAELLLASVLKRDRVFLLAHSEKRLTVCQRIKYRHLISLKINHWPTAYLTGHQEFFGLDFIVNRRTLIPRPETELLVESALKLIPRNNPTEVIEIGTGSGCIIIAVAKNNPNGKTNYRAIEISRGAIKIAELNAKRHRLNLKIKFINDTLLSPISNEEFSGSLIILANLPYLRPDQFNSSPSIQKEPRNALISGPDGLGLYRKLFDQASTLKAQDITLILEIDPSQAETITQLAKNHWPNAKVEILKDFCGHERIVIIKTN